jgi:hypothetical protein
MTLSTTGWRAASARRSSGHRPLQECLLDLGHSGIENPHTELYVARRPVPTDYPQGIGERVPTMHTPDVRLWIGTHPPRAAGAGAALAAAGWSNRRTEKILEDAVYRGHRHRFAARTDRGPVRWWARRL